MYMYFSKICNEFMSTTSFVASRRNAELKPIGSTFIMKLILPDICIQRDPADKSSGPIRTNNNTHFAPGGMKT